MREREPLGELPGSFVWGGSVKRHHGGRDAGGAEQLGAPAIADEHDFDQVRAPADGFFKAMNGHNAMFWM